MADFLKNSNGAAHTFISVLHLQIFCILVNFPGHTSPNVGSFGDVNQCGQEDSQLFASHRGHDQHGRHRPLRGRLGHLHRSGRHLISL